jgi:hypothetical protein
MTFKDDGEGSRWNITRDRQTRTQCILNKNRGITRLGIKKQKHNWLTQYTFQQKMPSSGVSIDVNCNFVCDT